MEENAFLHVTFALRQKLHPYYLELILRICGNGHIVKAIESFEKNPLVHIPTAVEFVISQV